MINRSELKSRIESAVKRSPVKAILGPRQCGKTTIARDFALGQKVTFFDLENPIDVARFESPLLTLQDLTGLVVIDEIQRMPELFEVLRVLADRPDVPAKFLILGSASPHLIAGASESLAGRIAFVDMGGFSMGEVGSANYAKLWLRGGFPPSYLANSEDDSVAWRLDFIRTFVERDVPQLGYSIPAQTLRRFWTMVAHFHGQVLNTSELARSLGSSESTARRYVDLLSGAFVIRQVPPWHENLRKRQVKSPKIYVRDTGILHAMLNVVDEESLASHGKVGASWEGYVVEQLCAIAGERNIHFWATHAGAELDLLLHHRGKRYGFEVKLADAPKTTKSMHSALSDLDLTRLFIVYPGPDTFTMRENITALSITDLRSWAAFAQT